MFKEKSICLRMYCNFWIIIRSETSLLQIAETWYCLLCQNTNWYKVSVFRPVLSNIAYFCLIKAASDQSGHNVDHKKINQTDDRGLYT